MSNTIRTTTVRYTCGCIGQRKNMRTAFTSWIFCGNKDCPFDPEDQHSKYA